MSGARWADIVDDAETSDAEASDEAAGPAAQTARRGGANAQRRSGRSGAHAARQRAERAAQRAARAAAAEPVPRAGGRAAVNRVLLAAQGGVAGGGLAAGTMTAALREMRDAHHDYWALADDAARRDFLRERQSFKPAPIELFTAGPGDIWVFAKILDTCIKIATTITAARYYDRQEDLGRAFFQSAFAGDAANLARTALADTPPSDHLAFRLHGALFALLQAFLPPRAAKEWRVACAQFAFPANTAQGWTELVRLYDLQCAIAELTATEVLHVKRLDPPTWGRFLQVLEDAVDGTPAQTWVTAALYSTTAQNVQTRPLMKSILAAHDPGGIGPGGVTGGGTLNAMRQPGTCYNCGEPGHLMRDCPMPPRPRVPRSGGLNVVGPHEAHYEHELIASLRDQVALQNQLLVAQDAMRVHDQRMSLNEGKMADIATRLGITGGQGASVSQVAAGGQPTEPLILGGAQPAGYVFVGTHPEGLIVWGRPDIVQDSITQAGAAK
jgi:hypothetical protein